MNCSTPGLPVHHHFSEFTQTHVHRVGDAIQPSHPLSSPLLLPPISPSIRVFSNESPLRMRWPKYWSFSFNIIPSKEIPGLISFRMDWLISLKSKGPSRVFSNTTVQKHQFFGAQPSSQFNSHIHTWPQETIALTRWTFVGKVMSLLFYMLSKHLLIAWLQSPSAVILELKSATVSTVSPSISHEVMGPDARCQKLRRWGCLFTLTENMGLTSKIGTDVKTGTGVLEIRVLHIIFFLLHVNICSKWSSPWTFLNFTKFQFYVEKLAVTGVDDGSVQRETFYNRDRIYILCLLTIHFPSTKVV